MADITAGAGRYDKYDPKAGGFRALLGADMAAAATPLAVGLDSSGDVVLGAGNSGIKGVIVLTTDKLTGDPVDVMTNGELVEVANATAGTTLVGETTTGVISDTAADATHIAIGYTLEATRLVVRKGE